MDAFPTRAETDIEPSRPVTVFLDEMPWDIRSRNTDWRYVRFDLPKLSEFEPSLHLRMQRSANISLIGNLKVLRAALGRRIGWPLSRLDELTSSLSKRDLRASIADIVFSHRAFPVNAGQVPVIWQNCVLDPAMQMAYGATAAIVDDEIATKGPLYRRAAAIQVSTDSEARRLAQTFPDIADRFVGVPFFTPHVRACDQAILQKHHEPGTVRILFTGNQAWRKGLDLLLEAFLSLPEATQKIAHLTIISNFVPPAVAVPANERITVLRGVDSTRVVEEMARSHIFVNVARFESYGLVFHEAMSQGVACLAPDWEVQRELFDNGAAGRLLQCRTDAIREALERLILQPDERYRLARAAWKRFQERYAPAIVAKKYATLFRLVAGRN